MKKNSQIKPFKIRCSAIGIIMTEAKGNITKLQQKELTFLEQKKQAGTLTEKQLVKFNELRFKKDNPKLSQTAKSYCKLWLKEHLYNRCYDFASKYTEKGKKVEQQSIDFAADKLGWGMVFKNNEYKENEFITGTCDLLFEDRIVDMKNAYDWTTFPLFETVPPDKNNEWQLQGYMSLYGKKKSQIVYTLMNLPEDLLEKEIKSYMYRNDIEDLSQEEFTELVKTYKYEDLPINLRIKEFPLIYYDATKIASVEQRVMQCRAYINELLKS